MDSPAKIFCYKCGQPAPTNNDDYPVCTKHGILWALRRNSICGETFIVREDGKVLLIKRAHKPMIGYWAIPGGFTDYGEQPGDTALREALEETGWRIEITGRILGVYLDSFPKDAHSEHRVVVSYLARPVSKETDVDLNEAQSCEWFDPKSLPQNIVPNHLNRFQDYLKSLSSVEEF